MRILITGGNGYIAKTLIQGLPQHDITFVTREDFDITDTEATGIFFEQNSYFDVVIHTATKGGSRLREDTAEVFYQNIKAFQNLIYFQHFFGKLIHFGSGAELGTLTTPYGLSKKIINDLCKLETKFYNIRIFAVFDENELDTRFIKSNVRRYINKEPIVLHQNKLMDFFYIKDLVTLVNHYIENENPPKVVECTYNKTYSLIDIASFINNLGDYKVEITQEWAEDFPSYSGKFTDLGLDYIGLKEGIKQVYNSLK